MTELADEFTEELYRSVRTAMKEVSYPGHTLHAMLGELGGVATAKRLLNSDTPAIGFDELTINQRLDLSIEAIIWDNPRFHPLFTDAERMTARSRLSQMNYFDNRVMKCPSNNR